MNPYPFESRMATEYDRGYEDSKYGRPFDKSDRPDNLKRAYREGWDMEKLRTEYMKKNAV